MTDAQRAFITAVQNLCVDANALQVVTAGRDWRKLEDFVANVALATRRVRNAFEDLE